MMMTFRFLVLRSLLAFIFFHTARGQQIADSIFDYPIRNPAYPRGKGSTVMLDEAHYNFHTLGGRYLAFGKLLQNDGYQIKSGHAPFSVEYLSGLKILVIANPLADEGPWRLPAKSAFTKDEIHSVRDWVNGGGNLLLIADHMPFAGAAAELAKAFGFNFLNGFAVRSDNRAEKFSRQLGNLHKTVITEGRSRQERVDSLQIFTGQAFIPPTDATVMTSLDDDYLILFPTEAWQFSDSTPVASGLGLANGAFKKIGRGRVVVMGEAAMFSAQLAGPNRNKTGMNHPAAVQNPQFLLNIMHWLDGKLESNK